MQQDRTLSVTEVPREVYVQTCFCFAAKYNY